MPTLDDGTKWTGNLTLSKKSGTVVTLLTDDNYIDKDIELTFGVIDGSIVNNTTLPSGSTSSGTINRGSYIKIGTGWHDEAYFQAQSVSGTLLVDSTDNANTNIDCASYANVNVSGINLPTPSSGTNSFSVVVPNGQSSQTVTFTVDSNGDVIVS